MDDRVGQRVRQLMTTIREQDRRSTPPFVDVLEAASEANRPRSPRRLRWLAPVALAAAATAVVVWGPWPQTAVPDPGDDELGEWVAPSNALLEDLGGRADSASLLAAASDLELWSFPSDILIEEADDAFGQEI